MIIEKLGGMGAITRATGVSHVTVQRWRWPVDEGGTGGEIPRKHRPAIVSLAEARGITLPPAAFVDAEFAADLFGQHS